MAARNIYGLTPESLSTFLKEQQLPAFRLTQIYDWLYRKNVTSFSEMTNLSKDLREQLEKEFYFALPKKSVVQHSKDGTIKALLELEDGAKVEAALMPYDYGNALCVSSEVGCNMGCAFCSSGLLKRERDLTAAEMVGQVLFFNQLLSERGEHVTHVVVMGTGEPFANYDNVLDFLKIINSEYGLAMGARHLTVSTCGLIDGIKRYAREGFQFNLAISLHAPNDELRKRLMPIAYRYSLKELIEAAREYVEVSHRRITFEYLMIKDLNDSLESADELADLLKGLLCYVNLIPFNPVSEKPFERSPRNRVFRFRDRLNMRGIKCTIRKEFGQDIDAACGQLRAKDKEQGK